MIKGADVARRLTGLNVVIEHATVAEGPYHYEERTIKLSNEFRNLRLFAPEQHDLALMKLVRGARHDIDVIAEIHARQPFVLDTFLKRFEEEMGHVLKAEKDMRLDFRFMITRLFGEAAGKRVLKKRQAGAGGIKV